ncbi:hypothetical protein ALC62_01953 [Cyphomyrmex costatus]|uniref:Uncharacterized protein n=1 Tax=Cyphomyrmex costatus TaxID=456900 RepID=A0A151INP9_9HYME|nr:hypothetical protein ALC62_01953 [Cyphomyrmex costatus]
MQRKHGLRLVTLRDSRIKFGIGATRHGYIFRQGGPGDASESTRRVFFRPFPFKGARNCLWTARVCATSDSTRSKDADFGREPVHSSERVYIRCVKTRQALIASAKKMRLHCQSTEGETFGSSPLIEEFYKKDTEGCVKTRYKSYDFIVDDCLPLRRAFVSSKKWNAANYASITLISEIILRSPAEINFNGPTFCN